MRILIHKFNKREQLPNVYFDSLYPRCERMFLNHLHVVCIPFSYPFLINNIIYLFLLACPWTFKIHVLIHKINISIVFYFPFSIFSRSQSPRTFLICWSCEIMYIETSWLDSSLATGTLNGCSYAFHCSLVTIIHSLWGSLILSGRSGIKTTAK